MKEINTFIVPYDSGSRIGKVSQSLHAWKKIFPNGKFLERQYSDLLPYLIEAEVSKTIQQDKIPLVLGGDHSLTYYTCKALTSIFGPINLLVFDAHHDSYRSHHLNHYTVFHHIQTQFKTKINLIGCRKDLDKNSIVSANMTSAPCYISLDVDFFSPTYVKSVVDPVQCENDFLYSIEKFNEILGSLNCKIIGADIVEWGGEMEETSEFIYIKQASELMLEFIQKASY